MLRLSKGEKIFYTIIIIALLMVNPPILNIINGYAKTNPLMLGYPTLWIWLQFWYGVVVAAFLVGVLKIANWKKEYEEK